MTTTQTLLTEDDLLRMPDDGYRAETLSPSDTAVEVEEKIASWLKAGVRAALVINPASRSITIYRSPSDISRLNDEEELDLSDVIDGFRCRVAEIFD